MKKTILYLITQSELGGAQKYVLELATNLKEKYNVFIAFGEQGKNGELARMAEQANIEFFVIKNLKREISLVNDFKAFWELKKLIKKIKPDIVHLNSSKISILGSLTSKLQKVPKIVYTAHGWVFNEDLPKTKLDKYKKIERFSAKFKDEIICVSNFDYKLAIKEKICKKEKLSVVHNGIKKPQFLLRKEAQLRIKKYIQKNNKKLNMNIDDSTILIGSIGNLYANKGYHFLINAVKLIVNQKKDIKLVIIGEGSEKKELLNEIIQLNLQKNIFIVGRIKNADSLLKAFDLYVCSSLKEGLSYTIIEAMLAKLPIIATQVGGNGELITKNKTGILINSRDSEKLASAILTLIKNKQVSEQLAQNAKIKAEQEFTLNKMINKTELIYNKTK